MTSIHDTSNYVNQKTVESLRRNPLPRCLRHATPWAVTLPMHVVTSIISLALEIDAGPAAVARAIRTAAQFGQRTDHKCAICGEPVKPPFVPNIWGHCGQFHFFATCLPCERKYSDVHDGEEVQP